MYRSNRILALYAELSGLVGTEHTPRVLMACAELFNGAANEPQFDLRQGGLSIEARGVDHVLDEACWALPIARDWDDDPTADCADNINMRSMFASLEREAFV